MQGATDKTLVSAFPDEQEMRPSSHERILVVDDSNSIRDFLRQLLPTEGYDVITARNGEEGLLLAQELAPDLIIGDYQMPGLNGLDMWRAVCDQGIQVPMILMTAEG